VRFGAVILACLMLAGCALGIPDMDPPVKPPEPCQIWVKVDNGPWRCHSRRRVLEDLKKIVPPSS
jgi:hypothetical protein